MLGLGKTGSAASNGSGDYVIAFSTNPGVRRQTREPRHSTTELANDETSALFQATVEATEEAIYNSLLMATSVSSRGGTVEALPVGEVLGVLRAYKVLR
jgi:D-aminopeptidase